MRARPIVLGVNAAHDAAVCVMAGGRVLAAVAEERLTRVKHQQGLPSRAIEYCLDAARVDGLEAVELIVLNEFPMTDCALELRRSGFGGELVVNPSHHLLHAYYAWISSGVEAAVLVTDGSGYGYGEYERRQSPLLGTPPPYSEMEEAESLYDADGSELRVVEKRWGLWEAGKPFLRFPSLGHMYSMASQYIFGGWEHAGKTMGLAPYGDAARFPDPIIECTDDGMTLDTAWITRLPERSPEPAHLDDVCRDVAAKVQAELERGIVHLCKLLHRATGRERLCLSGGVALNTVTNGRILRETPFSELFVTPAAGDTGTAIGAALYGHRLAAGELPGWSREDDFHGREYMDDELPAALDARSGLGSLRAGRRPSGRGRGGRRGRGRDRLVRGRERIRPARARPPQHDRRPPRPAHARPPERARQVPRAVSPIRRIGPGRARARVFRPGRGRSVHAHRGLRARGAAL
jgi:carbamoyltransferase